MNETHETHKYTLIRSRRKTLVLYIRDGALTVRAPLKCPQKYIDEFVAKKNRWITKNLTAQIENINKRKDFFLDYGDAVTYRGKLYKIVAKTGKRRGFDGEYFFMPGGLTSAEIKTACVKIYRTLAKDYLAKRTRELARKLYLDPESIRITNANSQWGSCSNGKRVNLSWRLIIAEDDVIDYVIIHELSHLSIMNHSARFWSSVKRIMPDYRDKISRLKVLQKNSIQRAGEFNYIIEL